MSEKTEPRFEEALALFERGQSLLSYCQEQLSAAELKVRELTFEDPGRTTTEGT